MIYCFLFLSFMFGTHSSGRGCQTCLRHRHGCAQTTPPKTNLYRAGHGHDCVP